MSPRKHSAAGPLGRRRLGLLALAAMLGAPGPAPAQRAPSPPKSKAADVAPPWRLAVDPAPARLRVPDDPAFTVACPTGDGVAYPDTPSPYVALGENKKPTDSRQVVDLRTGQPAGAIRGQHDFSDDARVSPDGQYLLTESKGGPVVPSRSIEVWSFRTGQLVRKIEASPTPATVHLHGFAVGNQAVTSRYVGKGDLISAWDVTTGRLAREILGPPSIREEAVALSPGGKYLALITSEPSLIAYDLTTGAKAAEVAVPKGGASHLRPEGLAFSPDGAELAAVFIAGAETRILAWDVAKGTLSVEHTLQGDAQLNVAGGQSYKGRGLEWLPDGSAWLLFGHTLVDRNGGRPVWVFRKAPGDSSPGPRVLVDADRMLVVAGKPRDSRRLEVVPLPWPRVDAALKAIEAQAPAHVRPGQPVSLKVDVARVRFGTPEAARVGIVKTLTERLAAEGIPVAEGRPTVLHAVYSEAAGETLQEMKGGAPFPGLGGGTPTGRSVQATTAQCLLSWEAAGSKKPLWSDRIDFNPGTLIIQGEATDAKARESAFAALQYQLAGRPIPYFVPKDEATASLPGLTILADAEPKRANRATTKPTKRGQARGR